MNKMNISFSSVALLYTAQYLNTCSVPRRRRRWNVRRGTEQRGIERRGNVQRGIVSSPVGLLFIPATTNSLTQIKYLLTNRDNKLKYLENQ